MRSETAPARAPAYGPWLVALGAALWGTESAWRIPLNQLFDAEVIVFWEHVLILIMFLPLLLPNLGELRKIDSKTWGYLLFSGFAGSAVGTIFFTLALKHGNPTVVNVVLNIQPIISTLGGFLLFGDRLARRFFPYAAIAIIAGIFLSVEYPALIGISFKGAGLTLGTGYALICAFFWGGSTVAGRGVMMQNAAAAGIRHANRRGLGVYDPDIDRLWQTAGRCALARGCADSCFPSSWIVVPAGFNLRWYSASDLFRRFASHPCIHRRLF